MTMIFLKWFHKLYSFINENQLFIFICMVLYTLIGFFLTKDTVYYFIYDISLIICWLGCLVLYDTGLK